MKLTTLLFTSTECPNTVLLRLLFLPRTAHTTVLTATTPTPVIMARTAMMLTLRIRLNTIKRTTLFLCPLRRRLPRLNRLCALRVFRFSTNLKIFNDLLLSTMVFFYLDFIRNINFSLFLPPRYVGTIFG
jgi:hypothetical protein